MAEDRRPELALAGLVRLLEYSGEARWLKWARGHLDTARSGPIDPTVLDAYGGIGSFNDLVLDPVNGHALDRIQVPWANRLLAVLGERVYQLAIERADERFEAAWVHVADPPIEGWRCLVCGHSEITDYDIEWWAARILVPVHVADSSLAEGPALVDTILSGQVLGATESRADVMARASVSGVHITDRDDAMRPCPACESADMVVYRWIFAGGGLHPAEHNVELRAPGFRHRPKTSPTKVASILDRHGCAHITAQLWELADKPNDELLDAQTDVMEALRGLEGSVHLTIHGDWGQVARRNGWKNVGDHTWLIPDSMLTRVMIQAHLAEGDWQMYVAPGPAEGADLPDLFRGEPASLPDTLARLGIVVLIDAWHDSTEWRVAVVPVGLVQTGINEQRSGPHVRKRQE